MNPSLQEISHWPLRLHSRLAFSGVLNLPHLACASVSVSNQALCAAQLAAKSDTAKRAMILLLTRSARVDFRLGFLFFK
jgi:hypothetical protein